MDHYDAQGFRSNVGIILTREDGCLLLGGRIGQAGWQFPQGGIDEGETAIAALHRELEEETGLNPSHYEILSNREGYRYDFPEDKPLKKDFARQEQTYFLCRFNGQDSDINLNTHHVEFGDYQWISPGEFKADWLPELKREVVMQALRDLLNT